MFQASFQALKETSSLHKACPFRELAFNGRQVRKAPKASRIHTARLEPSLSSCMRPWFNHS